MAHLSFCLYDYLLTCDLQNLSPIVNPSSYNASSLAVSLVVLPTSSGFSGRITKACSESSSLSSNSNCSLYVATRLLSATLNRG